MARRANSTATIQVLRDEALAETITEPGADDAGHCVGKATGCEADDHGNALFRIVLREGRQA